ncbi:MAG TPA: hypothetical protein VIL99_12095, partial [Ignavibacteria bacterium]
MNFSHIEEPIIKTIMLMACCLLALIGVYIFKKYSKVDVKRIFNINSKGTLILLINIIWVSLLVLFISYYENINSYAMIILFAGLIVFIVSNIIL